MKNFLIFTATFLLLSCNPSGNKAIIPLEEEHATETHEKVESKEMTIKKIDSTKQK